MEVTQADIIKMTSFLGGIHDSRRQQGNFRHNLIDILVIGLCTVISSLRLLILTRIKMNSAPNEKAVMRKTGAGSDSG